MVRRQPKAADETTVTSVTVPQKAPTPETTDTNDENQPQLHNKQSTGAVTEPESDLEQPTLTAKPKRQAAKKGPIKGKGPKEEAEAESKPKAQEQQPTAEQGATSKRKKMGTKADTTTDPSIVKVAAKSKAKAAGAKAKAATKAATKAAVAEPVENDTSKPVIKRGKAAAAEPAAKSTTAKKSGSDESDPKATTTTTVRKRKGSIEAADQATSTVSKVATAKKADSKAETTAPEPPKTAGRKRKGSLQGADDAVKDADTEHGTTVAKVTAKKGQAKPSTTTTETVQKQSDTSAAAAPPTTTRKRKGSIEEDAPATKKSAPANKAGKPVVKGKTKSDEDSKAETEPKKVAARGRKKSTSGVPSTEGANEESAAVPLQAANAAAKGSSDAPAVTETATTTAKRRRGSVETAAKSATKKGGKRATKTAEEDISKGSAAEVEEKPKRKRAAPKAKPEDHVAEGGEPAPKKTRSKSTTKKYDPAVDGRGPALDDEWESQINEVPNVEGVLKICSWNVNGLRSVVGKVRNKVTSANQYNGDLQAYIKTEQPDILCLNEVKADQDVFEGLLHHFPDYEAELVDSEKKGYAGVAILVKKAGDLHTKIEDKIIGIGEEEHDSEGRTLTLVFPGCCIVSSYVANAGQGLKRLDYRIEKFDKVLHSFLNGLKEKYKRPVIWCGDLNVAYEEIDIWDSKRNQKSAGHTPQERASFGSFLEDGSWVDIWRKNNPNMRRYTFWPARSVKSRIENLGWRLDYFIVSSELEENIVGTHIRDKFKGSDHCPILMCLKSSALLESQ